MANTHVFSKREEIANSITHGIGVVLSIVALVLLIVFASLKGNAWHVVSFTLFGSTMLLLYTSSTMLHSLPQGKAKNVFEILDHSSIYFFIAGTYTPFLFLAVKGSLGWSLFGVIWGLAIAGTVFKCFFVKKYLFVSTIGYLVLGWMITFAWGPIASHLPHEAMLLLVLGGVFYTVGAIFYVWRMFPYHHALWHLFVVAGSVMHFFCIFMYLLHL